MQCRPCRVAISSGWCLAKWLATEPRLLILDSPTVGVSMLARAQGIFRIVRQLAEEGLAILLISDEVTEVVYNADRVLHMANGKNSWRIRSKNNQRS